MPGLASGHTDFDLETPLERVDWMQSGIGKSSGALLAGWLAASSAAGLAWLGKLFCVWSAGPGLYVVVVVLFEEWYFGDASCTVLSHSGQQR